MIVHIHTGVIEGKFPKRALKMVMEWLGIDTTSRNLKQAPSSKVSLTKKPQKNLSSII